jgi:serine/threonine protein kinase
MAVEYQHKLLSHLGLADISHLVFETQDHPDIQINQIYEVHSLLGAGSYGLVFKVTCRKTNRQIAIKICR